MPGHAPIAFQHDHPPGFLDEGPGALVCGSSKDELGARLPGGVSAKLECPTITIGGVADHVHLLARMSRTISLAEWIKELKRASTVWMHEESPDFATFHWQAGYGAFSVSQSNTDAVVEYAQTQAEHHQKTTFKDEFRAMLRKHCIEWDERYVWD